MNVKEKFNHWLPVLLKTDGVTIGKTIYYKSSSPNNQLRNHERVHIEQYRKFGVLLFLTFYMLQYLYNRIKGLNHFEAYRNISFEKEAYSKEKEYE